MKAAKCQAEFALGAKVGQPPTYSRNRRESY